jgi:hypothetical protein
MYVTDMDGRTRVIEGAYFFRVLSNIARYNGDFPMGIWLSVMNHSIVLARAVMATHPDRPDLVRAALWHDASEALTQDLVAQKRAQFPALAEEIDQVQRKIFRGIGLPEQLDPIVAGYDVRIRANEGPIVLPGLPRSHWARYGKPLPGVEVFQSDLVREGSPYESCPYSCWAAAQDLDLLAVTAIAERCAMSEVADDLLADRLSDRQLPPGAWPAKRVVRLPSVKSRRAAPTLSGRGRVASVVGRGTG